VLYVKVIPSLLLLMADGLSLLLKKQEDFGAFEESGRAGVGVVIRDHQGTVLLSGWKVIFNVVSADEVEALACLEGIRLAANWERKRAVLESDCETMIKSLNKYHNGRSSLCFIFSDILDFASLLPDLKFQALKRERNQVAHELTQLAKHTTHTTVWCAQVPRCVEHLITHVCNSVHG
jgi:ribonuclease HI